MAAEEPSLEVLIGWLQTGTQPQQYRAALALRNLSTRALSKHVVRESGGVQALLALLDLPADSVLLVVAAETLSCLAADDPETQARHTGHMLVL